MVKEIALSLSNRHHFIDVSKMSDWYGLSKDTFMSLYDYDDYVIEYVKKKGSLSGFDGLIYMPDEFLLDVDGSSPKDARDKVIGLTLLLKDMLVPYNLYFSGTGFHVGIPSTAFIWKPSTDLHILVKNALQKAGIFEYADPSVTDKTRIIRVNNTLNSKSRLWKSCIPDSMLYEPIDILLEKVKIKSKTQPNFSLECNPAFDATSKTKPKKKNLVEDKNLGRNPDPVNYPCITSMLNGAVRGSRHATALRIASHLRWTYPEHVMRLVMEDWRKRVDNKEHPFTEKEMASIIENCYSGHDGAGYRYGCQDQIMDSNCKNTCRLYKSKASQNVMTADTMEKQLIDFYTTEQGGINLGAMYGQDFPVYPGEVVIVQAPPKSMKTMLLQNWVNYLKRPTYFLEMEMSPRQMWSRFVQIEKGWNEDQLREHYSAMRNGISEGFDWLTMDYSACHSQELQKRIQMLPRKPEIVIVDHMGLLRSNQKDNNMKGEEASQGLMELAIQHNIIVIAVSEITKQAFSEGMNLASAKGSFRIAYNANKVISVNPLKDNKGLIQSLHIKSEANREKESLNVKVWVDNVQIKGQEKSYGEQVFN